MRTPEEIEAQIIDLSKEHAVWAEQAERAIQRGDFTTLNACNADTCSAISATLKWVAHSGELPARIQEHEHVFA